MNSIANPNGREILVLRHGQVESSWKSICYGCMDVPLSALGADQSKSVAGLIARQWKPNLIYHSGLARTESVASQLAGMHHSATVLEDQRLRERNYGDWQGRSWDEVYAADPEHFHDLIERPDTYRPTSGETTSEMQTRMVSWFHSLGSLACSHSRIVAISHSGPIAAIAGYLLNLHARDWGPWILKELEGIMISLGSQHGQLSITKWAPDVWQD